MGLERKIKENQQMRTKHADEPGKFMDSEIELFEELHKLRELAAAPELYSDFVKLHGVDKVVIAPTISDGFLAHTPQYR